LLDKERALLDILSADCGLSSNEGFQKCIAEIRRAVMQDAKHARNIVECFQAAALVQEHETSTGYPLHLLSDEIPSCLVREIDVV